MLDRLCISAQLVLPAPASLGAPATSRPLSAAPKQTSVFHASAAELHLQRRSGLRWWVPLYSRPPQLIGAVDCFMFENRSLNGFGFPVRQMFIARICRALGLRKFCTFSQLLTLTSNVRPVAANAFWDIQKEVFDCLRTLCLPNRRLPSSIAG
jgi:hypothetical protein